MAVSTRRRLDRLQQVVHGVDVERLDRVLVVGGDENDRHGRLAIHQLAGQLEPGQTGHLDVEEHEVGRVAADRVDRFEAVAGLGDDLDAAHLVEDVAQLLARQLLVVDDHRAQQVDQALARSSATMSGISRRTDVPRPSSVDRLTALRAP